jgi:hypothetical protein
MVAPTRRSAQIHGEERSVASSDLRRLAVAFVFLFRLTARWSLEAANFSRKYGMEVADPRFNGRLQLLFSMTNPTLAHQLAAFASSLNFEDLSSNVVHEVKRRLIDSFE